MLDNIGQIEVAGIVAALDNPDFLTGDDAVIWKLTPLPPLWMTQILFARGDAVIALEALFLHLAITWLIYPNSCFSDHLVGIPRLLL